MDAAPEVLAALPDMSPEGAKAVLAQRQANPDDKQSLLRLLGAAQKYATTEVGRTFRLNIRLSFGNGKQRHSEVIITLFEEGPEPFSILSWRDEVGGHPERGTAL
jgi:general secretion pathway protein K